MIQYTFYLLHGTSYVLRYLYWSGGSVENIKHKILTFPYDKTLQTNNNKIVRAVVLATSHII